MNLFESSIMNFALAAAEGEGSSKSFLSTLWGMFSGRYAIGVYVIVILLVIIALIVLMITEENKLSELMSIKPKERSKLNIDVEANANISSDGIAGKGDGFYADGEEFEESGSRFYMLEKTDREMARREEPKYDDDADLEEICEQFRNFAASRMGLYYDISDIRRFIAGMAVSKILILQGMS